MLFAKYGVDTCSIILISEQEMEKTDALREERRLLDECPAVINKRRPVIDEEEVKEYNNKYNTEKYPCDICGKFITKTNTTSHRKTISCKIKLMGLKHENKI